VTPRIVIAPRATPALTPREVEVLTYYAQGYTARDIARRMQIGVTTVKQHVYRIKQKLDAYTIPHAVALAIAGEVLARDVAQQ
jgi:DNA-binding CsgD family transcriptional regulator